MASAWETPVHAILQYGQQTTLDLARNARFTTLPTALKRPYAEYADQAVPLISECLTRPPRIPQFQLQAGRIVENVAESNAPREQDASEYSQRVTASSTQGASQNPLLLLSHPRYGLPSGLVLNFEALGVRSIYPWQSSCLLWKGLLAGDANLIYTAPTGGGKSLVADVLLLKEVVDNPTKKAILVLPYVAFVQEKLRWLRKAVENATKNSDAINAHPQTKWRPINRSIRVAGFFGGSTAKATWSDVDVAVCTIEKANSLVNSAVEKGTIHELGAVVLVALHMLDDENRGYLMELALLEVIAIRLATTRDSLSDYIHQSLLWHTTNNTEVVVMVDVAMQELLESNLIQLTEHCSFEPTKLGSAIVAASLSPEDGISVHKDLCRSLESFVMDGEMHIFYLFTPVQFQDIKIDCGLCALRCVGIGPALVNKLVKSGAELPLRNEDEINLARIYVRACAAFQLRDICNENPLHSISTKYEVPRGFVQNLAQSCHGFATGMVKFCERMDWGMLAAVLEHMIDRLRAGARTDLLEMAQVVYVKSRMARMLWENGFKSVTALAESRPKDLIPVMMQAQGRKAQVQGEAAEKLKAKLMEKAEIIVGSANRIWDRQQLVELDE